VPPAPGCPGTGPSSPEVTRVICRVPSTPFSQAPGYALPVHLCRFGVRSVMLGLFPGTPPRRAQSDKGAQTLEFVTSSRPWNINQVPIDYAFRPRLRGRLTLRGLTVRRNPWTSGESVSHTLCRYSCQHSHLPYLQATSRAPFTGLGNAPLPRALRHTRSFGGWLEPRYIFGAGRLRSRPVSYYAFFKGWLLLSQPPGCHGLPTSFPT